MKFGVMNNPTKNIYKEIEWIGKNGFDFIDLSLEPLNAEGLDIQKVKRLLKRYNLDIVGHTAWHLPLNSPYKELRTFSYKRLLQYLRIFHKLGSPNMNVHYRGSISGFLFKKETIKWYVTELNKLIKEAKKCNMGIMIEHENAKPTHLKGYFKIFQKCPGLKFHLDIGHANLGKTNQTQKLLKTLGKRLEHVHVSDNHGEWDEHLTLGKGNINWPKIIKLLKKYKYNKTITLEIFDSRQGLLKSRNYIKRLLKC